MWLATVGLLALFALPALDLLLLTWGDDPAIRWIGAISKRKAVGAASLGGTGRLMVISGSSGFFSVDAELLEQRLGRPAYNLSTHAGLGLRYLLADAKENLRQGDTALLYLEYAHYRRKPLPLLDVERQAIWSFHPRRLLQLPLLEAVRQVYGTPLLEYEEGWQRRNRVMSPPYAFASPAPTYSAVQLGPRGDYRGSAPDPASPPPLELRGIGEPNGEAVKVLQEFFTWCRSRQIEIVAARPSVVRWPGASREEQEKAYHKLEPFYCEHEVRLLDTRATFQLPPELFYDTSYHANAAGRRIITEALARALQTPSTSEPFSTVAPLLLVAEPRSSARDIVLPRSTDRQARFVSAKELEHPLCLTLAEVRELSARGGNLMYADPLVGELLQAAGLSSRLVEERRISLEDFAAKNPQTVVVTGRPTQASARVQQANDEARGVRVARDGQDPQMFWAKDSTPVRGSASPRGWLLTAAASANPGWRFPAEIAVSADENKPAPIFIEGTPFPGTVGAGFPFVIYDPTTGRVLLDGFQDDERPFVQWQLFRVQAPLP